MRISLAIPICAVVVIGNAKSATDSLAPFALASNEELRVYEPWNRPEPCSSSDFEAFTPPHWANREEAKRLHELAEIAVRATGLTACECRVRYIASPLKHVEVFGIQHGQCMSYTNRAVAVDEDGATWLLSGDIDMSITGRFDLGVPQAALANYNKLTRREADTIDSERDAEEHMELFLLAYRPRTLSYLPTKGVADTIAKLPWLSRESDLLRDAFEQVRNPVVEVFQQDLEGYRGQAFVWEWSYGGIQRIEVRASRDGQISIAEARYAEQPRPERDTAE